MLTVSKAKRTTTAVCTVCRRDRRGRYPRTVPETPPNRQSVSADLDNTIYLPLIKKKNQSKIFEIHAQYVTIKKNAYEKHPGTGVAVIIVCVFNTEITTRVFFIFSKVFSYETNDGRRHL